VARKGRPEPFGAGSGLERKAVSALETALTYVEKQEREIERIKRRRGIILLRFPSFRQG